ncbi:MAG: DUF2835 family protein [Gammaproteobacteria bacterium]|nr:MAG: DUF2835 family protein [Gammaproteobacteria bacterium]
MRSIIVPLKIYPDEFQRLYEGNVKEVSARSIDGLRVRFPANILRSYVTHAGVIGTFAIHFSDENKFLSIEKID